MIDGASKGNPGKAAVGGYIIKDCKILDLWSEKIGITTNNVAEYQALLSCLQRAKRLGIKKLTIMMDSKLLYMQIQDKYKVKTKKLLEFSKKIRKLLQDMDVKFLLVKREENKFADRLAHLSLKD